MAREKTQIAKFINFGPSISMWEIASKWTYINVQSLSATVVLTVPNGSKSLEVFGLVWFVFFPGWSVLYTIKFYEIYKQLSYKS